MREVKEVASNEVDRLNRVTVTHFKRAYQGDKEASKIVNEYIHGVFPEWAPMPEWFKTLISEFNE